MSKGVVYHGFVSVPMSSQVDDMSVYMAIARHVHLGSATVVEQGCRVISSHIFPFSVVWGWRTVVLQLSGFYCRRHTPWLTSGINYISFWWFLGG